MPTEAQRAEIQQTNEKAFRLCAEWQKSQHRQHGFSLDEISAFMQGVMAAEVENERLRAALAPFAKVAGAYEEGHTRRAALHAEEGRTIQPLPDHHRISVSLGECRAAKQALEQSAGEPSR